MDFRFYKKKWNLVFFCRKHSEIFDFGKIGFFFLTFVIGDILKLDVQAIFWRTDRRLIFIMEDGQKFLNFSTLEFQYYRK